MILEGLATTRNPDGTINLSAMGPLWDDSMQTLILRPFPTSVTYANLMREKAGVWHIIDDALLLVQAALDAWGESSLPPLNPACQVNGQVLQDCCRWYEFVVSQVDESGERPCFHAQVVHRGQGREFVGWNRARHAILEGAILVSRWQFLGIEETRRELQNLWSPVRKTGGPREILAMELVENVLEQRWATAQQTEASR